MKFVSKKSMIQMDRSIVEKFSTENVTRQRLYLEWILLICLWHWFSLVFYLGKNNDKVEIQGQQNFTIGFVHKNQFWQIGFNGKNVKFVHIFWRQNKNQ